VNDEAMTYEPLLIIGLGSPSLKNVWTSRRPTAVSPVRLRRSPDAVDGIDGSEQPPPGWRER